jgi:hypothetical protein
VLGMESCEAGGGGGVGIREQTGSGETHVVAQGAARAGSEDQGGFPPEGCMSRTRTRSHDDSPGCHARLGVCG